MWPPWTKTKLTASTMYLLNKNGITDNTTQRAKRFIIFVISKQPT
uniref:Uncharacterized protein n=1 Tax=Arundo donax TaxID=35708 RepID=A0A0A9FHL2_ARUDO